MRLNFSVLALMVVSSFANANGIPDDVLDVIPDYYSCERLRDPIRNAKEQFSISRKSDSYVLEFKKGEIPSFGAGSGKIVQRPQPGTLEQYLKPLGVDERIIAYYTDWEIDPIKVPATSCTAKTFGSLHAEELDCSAQGVTLKITATGPRGADVYTIKNAGVQFNTKVKSGMEGTYCNAKYYDYNGINKSLVLNFDLDFKGRNRKPVKINSSFAFHPDCSNYVDSEGYGGNTYTHGYCHLSGGIRYGIGVGALIKLREQE